MQEFLLGNQWLGLYGILIFPISFEKRRSYAALDRHQLFPMSLKMSRIPAYPVSRPLAV
jgi:hypothetical protein